MELPARAPLTEADLSAVLAPYLWTCAATLRDSVRLDAWNARESAEDLEDLRRALGAERLTLWGISYGTHLALAYLRAHPDRVERAILAGVEGPDHTWKDPAAIDRIFFRVDSAARADERLDETGRDLAGAFRSALARLEENPVTVDVEDPRGGVFRVTVGPLDLRRAIYYAMGEREDIAEIPRRVALLARGDFRPLGEWALRTRRDNRESGMALSVDCASGTTDPRRERIRRQAEGALFDDVANLDIAVRCAAWPVEEMDESFRAPVRAATPTLFISGTLDARTPPENAEEVLAGFPNGRHLILEGASHDDDLFLSSPQIEEAMLRFLRTGEPGVKRIVLPTLRFRD